MSVRCRGASRVALVLCAVFLGFLSIVRGQEGESCVDAETNRAGVCSTLLNCPTALALLQQEQIHPQICDYQGTVPIVCCVQGGQPTASPQVRPPVVTPSSQGRPLGQISKQKCEEYAKYVYYKKRRPTLSFGTNREQILTDCRIVIKTLIVGGKKAKEAEYPHMALIGYNDNNGGKIWSCGGSIISERYILTAGHCLYSRSFGNASYVRIGITNINDDDYRQEFNILERIAHPEYAQPSHYNDIALLKVDKDATFNPVVRPACLYTEEQLTTRIAIATGWGKTEFAGITSDDLLKVVLEYIDTDHCNTSYSRYIGRKLKYGIDPSIQICAGSYTEKKDTCQGDSGGPLQITNLGRTPETNATYCTYSVVGVTSFGKPCGIVNSPGVYTKVYAHLKWIEDTVWPQ